MTLNCNGVIHKVPVPYKAPGVNANMKSSVKQQLTQLRQKMEKITAAAVVGDNGKLLPSSTSSLKRQRSNQAGGDVESADGQPLMNELFDDSCSEWFKF